MLLKDHMKLNMHHLILYKDQLDSIHLAGKQTPYNQENLSKMQYLSLFITDYDLMSLL